MPRYFVIQPGNPAIALTTDANAAGTLIPVPEAFDEKNLVYCQYDPAKQTVSCDNAAFLASVKASRGLSIKQEAARLISALDWKLQRAQEWLQSGAGTVAEVDAVLAMREAIRQSSNAAEAAVEALTDAASVQAFTWSVDVVVPVPRRISSSDFVKRFQEAEVQAILEAAKTNAAVQSLWERFRLEDPINLDSVTVQSGVHALELAGLIAAGRAAEILA